MRKKAAAIMMTFVLLILSGCGKGNKDRKSFQDWITGKTTAEQEDTSETGEKGDVVAEGTDLMGAKWSIGADGTMTVKCDNAIESNLNARDYPWHDYADSVTSLMITGDITRIPSLAFSDFSNMKYLTMPDSVKYLDISCFKNCSALEEIKLPSNLESMDFFVFSGCDSLKEVVIPGTLKEISNYGFAYCESLRRVVISEGVEKINIDAFDSCSSLTELYLPRSLTYIDQYAFRGTLIKDLYYQGTKEEFAAITIMNDNEPLKAANIHYEASEEDITGQTEQKDGPSGGNSDEASVEGTVIVDQNGVKVTVGNLDYNGEYGPELKLLIENNTGRGLSIDAMDESVNGCMVSTSLNEKVNAGEKAEISMTLLNDFLNDYGIKTISDIEFVLRCYYSDNYEECFETDLIRIRTSEDDIVQTVVDSGEVLYDKNGIKIVRQSFYDDGMLNPYWKIYIENNTDKNINIETSEVVVNGTPVDAVMVGHAAPRKKDVVWLSLVRSSLEEKGISSFDTATVTFEIIDRNGWTTIEFTEPLSISF